MIRNQNRSNVAIPTTVATTGGISDTDQNFEVADATGYPGSGFIARIGDSYPWEIVFVGSRSGTTFQNVTRGVAGSSAQVHTEGTGVVHTFTERELLGEGITQVSPEDDWHQVVGDEEDPVTSGTYLVMPGEHTIRRRTLFEVGASVHVVGLGGATLQKPTDLVDSPLTSDASQGDQTIDVQDGSIFTEGRGIVVYEPNNTGTMGRRTFHTHIQAISGDTITLASPVDSLGGTYSASGGAACSQTHSFLTTTLSGDTYDGLDISGLAFDGRGRSVDATASFSVAGVYSFGDVGGSIRDCEFFDHHSEAISSQRGTSIDIHNNEIRNQRFNGIHTGLQSEGTDLRNNTIKNCGGTGLYTSDGLNGVTIVSNEVFDCEGQNPLNPPPSYSSNAGGIGDLDAGGGDNDNNTLRDNLVDLTGVNAMGVEIGAVSNVKVTGNRIFGNEDGVVANGATDLALRNNTIDVSGQARNLSGTRITVNGWGQSSGPPASTGEWSGQGIQGVGVRDVSNDKLFLYLQGAWRLVGALDGAPSAPTGLSATALDAEVTLSWDDVVGENGFRVYRNTSNDFSTASQVGGDLSADTTSFSDTGVSNGTQYYYWVTAFNANGESAESNSVTATPSSSGSGSTFTNDFSQYTDGEDLYTQDWSSSNGNTFDTFEKQSSGGESFAKIVDATAQESPALWDVLTPENTIDCDILIEVSFNTVNLDNEIYASARMQGDTTYYRGGGRSISGSRTRRIDKLDASSFSGLATGDASGAGTSIRFLFRFNITGNSLELTYWQKGDTEPAPQLTATDSAISSDGGVGIEGFRSSMDINLYYFAVGLGTKAPLP